MAECSMSSSVFDIGDIASEDEDGMIKVLAWTIVVVITMLAICLVIFGITK